MPIQDIWKTVLRTAVHLILFTKAGPSFLSAMLFSTHVTRTSTEDSVPERAVDTENILLDHAPLETPSLPIVAYTGMRVKDHTLNIVEISDDHTNAYHKPLLHEDVIGEILDWLEQSVQQRHLQFIAAVVQEEDQPRDIVSRLWLQEDIVPYVIGKQDAAQQPVLEKQVKDIVADFDKNNIILPKIDAKREIHVSELVSLEDYQKTASQEDFAHVLKLAQAFQGQRLAFISATPQGGGVALMRHALIRFFRLLGVDAHWYVLQPKKEVFDITKAKFHNVLQAVASEDIVLTTEDMAIYDAWMQENATILEGVFKQTDVIVIDDPQPSGLIPYIKQVKPDSKIIYRSHIQIVGKLANQPGTPQSITWNFLWNNIQHADYFISHPISEFIPANVPEEKIFYMPATTDPLDGLNKPLTEKQMSNYLQLFNDLLKEAQQTPLDKTRPYIIQVARFDPSKGIPDVIEAYQKLRTQLEEQNKPVPQLVITGNSSVDDPDGVPIYNLVKNLVDAFPDPRFANDVKVVRLPHRDQILNTLLRKSSVVLQLSIKEGFEVKVTEALLKGKPVIAYKTGGIPLQIQDGNTGYLVEVGNTSQVARLLYDLLTDENKYEAMSEAAVTHADKDYLTIPNALCWLFLALQLLKGEHMEGHRQWVKVLAQQHFEE